MQTKQSNVLIFFAWFLFLLTVIALIFSFFAFRYASQTVSDSDQSTSIPPFTVVLDAGHGGEDGGASSASGIIEKNLNLSIAVKIKEILEANGVTVVMTRTEDRLLYDRNTDFQGRKKALDLLARRKIAEETKNAIFVSIHMNAYPVEKYHGLQVWYSPNNRHSEELASSIREIAQHTLQPENDRAIKSATSSIYLLHHLQIPSVLIECGFLSNPSEAERLNDPSYQQQLAFWIALSILHAQNLEIG